MAKAKSEALKKKMEGGKCKHCGSKKHMTKECDRILEKDEKHEEEEEKDEE